MKIAVYCSANRNIDPDFFKMTEELGGWIGENGHIAVFGGCDMGLMECLAKAVHDAGGKTIGVIPAIIEKNGRKSDFVDICIPCDNLSDRKDMFMVQGDVHVVLPGGIGTLDELFTVAASATIGYHGKRIILYNMKCGWNSLIALLDDLQQRGFIRGEWRECIRVANDLQELAEMIQ